MRALMICVLALTVASVGCNSPTPRINAPPHGTAEKVNPLQSTYVYMSDNALLADMTVSDIHFFPDRPLLNSLGEQRLSRLASLMDAYGGKIRFSTDSRDKDLVAGRIAAVTDYLREAGVDVLADVVERDEPGGRGMDATEVMLIKQNEGTYKPGKKNVGSENPLGGQN